MAATLNDVAALADVSVSAVSRVLSGSEAIRVRPETRERIQAAARELGYRPNHAGRALKLSRSNVLALVVPDVTSAIFSELLRGVEDAAIARDYTVLLGRSADMQPGGAMIGKLLGEGRIDGALVQLDDEARRADVERLLDAQSRVVFVNSLVGAGLTSVVLPDREAARAATQHLLDLGHRRIAFIGGNASRTAEGREQGFTDAVAGAGVAVPAAWLTQLGYAAEHGREAMRSIWTRADRPTAVVAANLNAAIGALAEARAMGIHVPEDLSIVAVHDAWIAEHTWPALTTVRMPLLELGRTALEALIDLLGGAGPRTVVVSDPPPRLVLRASTALPRAAG